MNKQRWATLALAILLLGGAQIAHAEFSFSVGTDDFYLSVGDYDYLPYAYAAHPYSQPPRISFYSMLGQYGGWVYMQPFGQVWRPYAAYGWRPYTHGHWVYTQYGPTWVGYEPWAWVGYHYGNWVWSAQFGWVWIPGYDWHPGRVVWAQSYDSIGWMPAPPYGYDYSRGYLGYIGPVNQFTYYDDDFAGGYQDGYYSYGGPYYDPRYSDLYYNPSYLNISVNLWVFINNNRFGYDNYADHCMTGDYARFALDRRAVRITSRPLERTTLERVVRQQVREVPVQVKEFDTDQKRIRVVVPEGESERIKVNANRTVREVIAPAFAEKQKTFKGEKSQNVQAVSRLFKQENKRPKIETVSSDDVIRRAKETSRIREQKSVDTLKKQEEEFLQIEKQGKVRETKTKKPKQEQSDRPDTPRKPDVEKKDKPDTQKVQTDRDSQFKPQEPKRETSFESPQPKKPDTIKEKEKPKTQDVRPGNRPEPKEIESNSKKQKDVPNTRQMEEPDDRLKAKELPEQSQRDIQKKDPGVEETQTMEQTQELKGKEQESEDQKKASEKKEADKKKSDQDKKEKSQKESDKEKKEKPNRRF